MVASLVRDIVCFTPLAICLPAMLERNQPGSGIHGILFKDAEQAERDLNALVETLNE